jgi:hypothetical protein
MSAASIAEGLGGKLLASGWWQCQCPAHEDASPSLGVRDGDSGGIIVNCLAGCSRGDILAALRREGYLTGTGKTAAPSSAELAERRAAQERAAKRGTALGNADLAIEPPGDRNHPGTAVSGGPRNHDADSADHPGARGARPLWPAPQRWEFAADGGGY